MATNNTEQDKEVVDQGVVGAPSEAEKRQAEADAQAVAAEKAAKQAAKDAEAQAKADAKDAPKGQTYLKSPHYAGLVILKKDGTSVRFQPYYDTFKGDQIKVGFLATDDKEVIERCKSLGEIEVITQKDFEAETSTLEKAPVYSV